jgi:hypothetical protein
MRACRGEAHAVFSPACSRRLNGRGALCRARANSAATLGKYKADANGARGIKHTESLHEKDYKY